MEIRRQDADFTLGGEDSAISCPVGVHPVTAVMFSIIALQRSSCATGAPLTPLEILQREMIEYRKGKFLTG